MSSLGLLDQTSSNSGRDLARSVVFDSTGAMYVSGGYGDQDFPFPDPNAYDTTLASGGSTPGTIGPIDAFISKFDTNGQLLWTTSFGGPNHDRTYAMEIDENGPNPGIVIVGRAGPGLPTTAGVVQPNFAGDNNANPRYGQQDGFVAKFSLDGRNLLWSTYIGGAGRGFVRGVDIDSQGRIHLGFVAVSESGYVTGNAIRGTRQGTADANYIVLSENGRSIEYGTYLGGTSTGYIEPISSIQVIENNGTFAGTYINFVDNAGDVPTTPNAFQPNRGGSSVNEDIVVARLTSTFALDWMTYLGGGSPEFMETHGLEIDSAGRPVIAAQTFSNDFPTTANAYDRTFNGGVADGFISILSADGQTLDASSYFGGSGTEIFEGVDLLSDGTIVVGGTTSSSGLPTSTGAYQTFRGGAEDGLVMRWAANLSDVLELTYVGGGADDKIGDVSTSASDHVGLAGTAASNPFRAVNSNDSAVNGVTAAVYGRMTPN